MIDTSTKFKRAVSNDNRNFLPFLDITLKDGTVLNLTEEKIWENSFRVEDATSASGTFTIGAAVTGKLTVTINNIYDNFSEYDFTGAEAVGYIGLQLSGTLEKLRVGTYTVDDPNYNGSTITLTLLDNMSKFDRPYSESTLQYPATCGGILADACGCCGVTLLTTTFDNSDYVVAERPNDEALTFGDIVACVAQIACKFAKMDAYGRLKLDWYNMTVFEQESNLDGGTFGTADTPYSDGDSADGGNFTDYTSGDSADGGTFAGQKKYHHIYSTNAFSVSTDDVVITGVRVTGESGEGTYLAGAEGYVIEVSGNALIQSGKAQTVAEYLYSKVGGMRFRPLTISALADPSIEAGDVAYFTDRKGNSYQAFVSNRVFTLGGFEEISCDAETPSRNSAKRFSEMTKAVVQARKETKKELSGYDKTVQQLTSLMAQSFGVFKTEEKAEDGSTIYYMHNKPELSSSSTIWKMTADAFAVSTDGGQTWNAGMDSEGNALVNVLSAIGIKFDWARGGTLTLGGEDNVDGVLEVRSASGELVATLSKDGLSTNSANITGGTIKIATDGTESSVIRLSYTLESGMSYYARISPTWIRMQNVEAGSSSASSGASSDLMSDRLRFTWYNNGVKVQSQLTPASLKFYEDGNLIGGIEGGKVIGNEHGSNANGEYYKFHDGTLICVKKMDISASCNNAWGALYDSSEINMGAWPYAFVDVPAISPPAFCTNNYFAWAEGVSGASATSAGKTFLCRATLVDELITGTLHIAGIGRWK